MVNIIKEKIEKVLHAEEEAKNIIDSAYKQADTIIAKARDTIREIEKNVLNQADEVIMEARSKIHAETSRTLQEMEIRTQEEIRLIRESGERNMSSTVSFIINKMLGK